MRAILISLLLLAGSASADDGIRHIGPVTAIVANGSDIYSCSQAGVLKCADSTSQLTEIAVPSFRVTAIAMLGDQQLAMCGGLPGESGSIGVIELASGKWTAHEFTKDLIYAVAIAPSHEFLAAACADGNVLLFRLPLNTATLPVVIHKHTAAARSLAFSPDGKFLLSGGLDGVMLMTPVEKSGSRAGETRSLQEHTSGIECLAFSPDGKQFASGARDSKVRLHAIDGRFIRTYAGIGIEDEPAAERLATRIWAVAWRKDTLVAGTSKGTLYRLSLKDDTWFKRQRTGKGAIYSLAFSDDESLWIGSDFIELAR